MTEGKGHYLGTEVGGKWWRRCREASLFARGNGEWWLEDDALCFRRYLTRNAIRIPLAALLAVETGDWHAGRWSPGRPVLKLVWEREGERLSSGFTFALDPEGLAALRREIGRRAGLEAPTAAARNSSAPG